MKKVVVVLVLMLALAIGVVHVHGDGVDYDYFYLVQQWPKSFCNTGIIRDECWAQDPYFKTHLNYFIIHGLWPEKNDMPVVCPETPPFRKNMLSEELMKTMNKWWPSLKKIHDKNLPVWIHQWLKHGTCTSKTFPQPAYFKIACDRANDLHLTDMLRRSGITAGNSYTITKIKNAIESTSKLTPRIECNKDKNGKRQLFQIIFCVDKTGTQFQNCTFNARCGSALSNDPILFPI